MELTNDNVSLVNGVLNRAGLTTRRVLASRIDSMIQEEVIEPEITEWKSSIVFAPKKDSPIWFCADYCKLSAATISDSNTLPRMHRWIGSLGDARMFLTPDANSSHWQVVSTEQDGEETAFASLHGLYQYVRIPFGLKKASAIFQRAICGIVSSVEWQLVIVYLYNIVVFPETVQQILTYRQTILNLLWSAGITLKFKSVPSSRWR